VIAARARLAIACALAVSAGTCGEYYDVRASALDRYSTNYTCPAGRVTVRRRTDVPAHTLNDSAGHVHVPTPPPEVALDAERLALWHRQRRPETPQWDDYDRGYQVWEASGCGHWSLILCQEWGSCEVTRLGAMAELPLLSEPQPVPPLAAPVRALRVALHALPVPFGYDAPSAEEIAERNPVCLREGTEVMRVVGWTVAAADAPHDVDVDYYCSTSVEGEGSIVDVRVAERESPSLRVRVGESVIVEVPRALLHSRCELDVSADHVQGACTDRARAYIGAQIAQTLSSSPALRDFATDRRLPRVPERHAPADVARAPESCTGAAVDSARCRSSGGSAATPQAPLSPTARAAP
jgi:hypothetical protein